MTNIPVSERVNFIGASEVAILFGVSPFGTLFQKWHEKAGSVPPENLDDNERVMAGQYLEAGIGAWAAKKWDWPLENVREYIQHPTVAQFGCSLDFATTNGEPVETKVVDYLVFRDEWDAESDEILDAPAHYLLQVQSQLACTGKDHGWLLACVGGNRLLRMRVDRHPGVIARIETEVDAFWDSVREGREPPPDFSSDGPTISRLHCVGNGEWLDLTDNNRLPDLCSTYKAAKAQEKDAKGEADTALAEIRSIIGSAAGASCAGFEIKASDIREGEVKAFTRKAYRRFNIKEIANG